MGTGIRTVVGLVDRPCRGVEAVERHLQQGLQASPVAGSVVWELRSRTINQEPKRDICSAGDVEQVPAAGAVAIAWQESAGVVEQVP